MSTNGAPDETTPGQLEVEPPSDWIVRGGIVTPVQLRRGTVEHPAQRGLYGFSVQHQLGHTITALARAGRFPNAQISVTTGGELVAAGRNAEYDVRVVKSPGRGFHHAVEVPYPLPQVLAVALSAIFRTMPNPARLV